MKNPNGWGTVVKLSGNRRRPFVVRKTKGYNAKGFPIYENIGYYTTKEEGMIALAVYNQDPYDTDIAKLTMRQLYEKLLESSAIKKLAKSSINSLKSAYKHCEPIHHLTYREIKAWQMQKCVDQCGCGYSTQGAIKNLFVHLDRLALSLDLDIKNFSQLITIESVPSTKKKIFSNDEVSLLWNFKNEPWIDSILVLLYSGWRISELLTLRNSDVDLKQRIMTGGTKTKNGKERIIPIHSKISSIIKSRYDKKEEYLFAHNNKMISLTTYYNFWREMMQIFNMKHTPHECRHTFRSWLDSAGANKVCIDKLMGHVPAGTGDRIYTHKSVDDLRNAIEMI